MSRRHIQKAGVFWKFSLETRESASKHFSRFAVRLDDTARKGTESELTLTVFPRGPFPVTADLRFRRRVSARTHVRSICMRPAQGAGCRAGSKRGCYPPGSRGYNFSPIPETKEEKSRFRQVPRLLLDFSPPSLFFPPPFRRPCRFNTTPSPSFITCIVLLLGWMDHRFFCGDK